MNKIFDKKNVILIKIDDSDLASFLVDSDINDAGVYEWRIKELAESVINVVPEYVFANHMGGSILQTDIIEAVRESAKALYKVKEYDLMRRYCIHNDQDALIELHKSGYKNRGEFGELLLHLLLREYKDTIPLISKVYFKDSPGVPAHGFDAVHITPKQQILWLGESKLYGDAKGGLKALLQDLDEHFKKDYINDQFLIIKKNLENHSIPHRDEWVEKLSKCNKLSDQIKMINIPMLCVYPDDIYSKFPDTANSQAFAYHEKSIRELKKYFEDNNHHPLKGKLNVILFTFPIKDKMEFVTEVHNRLWHMQNL
jgi:hypothetical protein